MNLETVLASVKGARYSEVRLRSAVMSGFFFNKQYSENVFRRNTGAGARIIVDNCWGCASTDWVDAESLSVILQQAYSLSKASEHYTERKALLDESPALVDKVDLCPQARSQVPLSEKKAWLTDLAAAIYDVSPFVKNVTISYQQAEITDIFVNSCGAHLRQSRVITILRCSVAGIKKGRSTISTHTVGGLGGFELLGELPQDELSEALTVPMLKALEGIPPSPGRNTAVLDPSLTGILVHETLGHFLEGDLVASGTSPVKDKMGQLIAHSDFTLVDDPTICGVGSYAYDDEGCQGKRITLIQEGCLNHFLLDRQTAAQRGEMSTGNGRAEDHRQLPLVRMSNTMLLPGEWRLEELLEDTQDGVYLTGCVSGNANSSTGTFTFTAQGGYRIVNGELAEPLLGATITGHIEDVLFNISAIGNDMEMQANSCVKNNQNVLVGCGSPHIRVEKLQMR